MLKNDGDRSADEKLLATCKTASRKEPEVWLKNVHWKDALFNSDYVLSIVTDEQGVIQVLNPGASRMLGYSAAEVVGLLSIVKLFDLKHLPDVAEQISADINSLNTGVAEERTFSLLVSKASQGKEDVYELKQIRKDGTYFPTIGVAVAIHDAENRRVGYLFSGRDNTEHRKMEQAQAQALRESEQHAQRILDTASDAFIAMNAKGEVTEWNVRAQQLFGWTREEVIGKILSETIMSPNFRESHERGLKHYLATGEGPVLNRTVEVSGIHRDGRDIAIQLSVWVVKTPDGFGFNSFIHDLTKIKEIEKRKLTELSLLARNIELEHSSRMKSEFLATMSHELRTPLNAIIGFSEAVKDGLAGTLNETQKEFLGDIFNSGEHLLSLINDILDLSKIEAGMMTLDLEPVNLKVLLTKSLSIVRDRAVSQRVQVEIDISEDLGVSQLDSRKTKQILYNLLSNAVKFTPENGRVSLSAKRVPRSAVGLIAGPWPVQNFEFLTTHHQDFFEISVADTGIGLTIENISKLFQAFSQVDSSLSRKFDGTGLGLAMAKQLAELHGGSIAVASQENQGSRFVVWLPRVETML